MVDRECKDNFQQFREIKIDKEYQTERIDVIDAIIDAWTAAMKGEVKQNTAESVEEWLKLYEASKKNRRGVMRVECMAEVQRMDCKKMNFTVETSPAMKEESFLEWLGVKRKTRM